MYFTARTQAEHFEGIMKILHLCKAKNILYCKEDTGCNPHYHFLFQTHVKVSTIRTYRQKVNIPKGQKQAVFAELRVEEGLSEQDAVKKYKLYMCKGYNVSSKELHKYFKDGKYIGELPQTKGFYMGETESLHQEFWENFKNFKIIGQEKKVQKTGTANFISYLEEHLHIERDSDDIKNCTEKYLRIRYKDIIVPQIIELAYHYCRKMDKSCIELVVKNLVSAGLNRFDDTGLFLKYETRKLSEYFFERMG